MFKQERKDGNKMEDRGYNERSLPGEVSENSDGYYTDLTKEEPDNKGHMTVLDGVPRSRVWSVISLVAAIISVLLFVVCIFYWVSILPIVSTVMGVAAILFSLLSRRNLGYFDGVAIAGIIIGAMGTVFGASSYILMTFIC